MAAPIRPGHQPEPHLFEGALLSERARQREEEARRLVTRLNDLSLLDSDAEEWFERQRWTPVVFDRAKAEFGQTATATGTRVTLTVPFSGSSALLQHRPQTMPIENARAFVGQVRFTHVGTKVVTAKDFGAPNQDEVRRWGKAYLDSLEQHLTVAKPEAVESDRSLRATLDDAVRSRRLMLQAGASLDGMEPGI